MPRKRDQSEERVLDFIRAWVVGVPEIHRVILFGSRARKDAEARSDFDVAVDAPTMTDAQWSRLALELREKIPTLCGLDLVRLNSDLSSELKNKIRMEGIEIYVRK